MIKPEKLWQRFSLLDEFGNFTSEKKKKKKKKTKNENSLLGIYLMLLIFDVPWIHSARTSINALETHTYRRVHLNKANHPT